MSNGGLAASGDLGVERMVQWHVWLSEEPYVGVFKGTPFSTEAVYWLPYQTGFWTCIYMFSYYYILFFTSYEASKSNLVW
jgi:hypothetical protein